jgi:L-2-hydroxyglutarate oxidase LhgO
MLYTLPGGKHVEINKMDFVTDKEYYEHIMKIYQSYQQESIFTEKRAKRFDSIDAITKALGKDIFTTRIK